MINVKKKIFSYKNLKDKIDKNVITKFQLNTFEVSQKMDKFVTNYSYILRMTTTIYC